MEGLLIQRSPNAFERPGLLPGELPVAAEDDGHCRLHCCPLVIAVGDGLAAIEKDFGDGVVEKDVEVERAFVYAGDLFAADGGGVG